MLRNLLAELKYNLAWQFEKSSLCAKHGCIIEPGARIKFQRNLNIGKNVKIGSGALIHCGEKRRDAGRENVSIGDNTYIGPNSVLFGEGGIEIGKNCEIAPGVVITSQQHTFGRIDIPIKEQPSELKEVVLEEDVWIGCNASVLPGVRVGKGAVIGAGAVVNKDILPYSVAVGVPAKVIKERAAHAELACR